MLYSTGFSLYLSSIPLYNLNKYDNNTKGGFRVEDKRNITDKEFYELTIIQKRQRLLSILFIFLFTALIGRLFWIQVLQYERNIKKSVSQKLRTFQTSIDRGQIYDRKLIPFTNRELKKIICISTTLIDKEISSEIIAKAAGLSIEEVKKRLSSTDDTIEIETKNFNNEYLDIIEKGRVKGVFALEKKVRYNSQSLARHVIGYINKSDNKGIMGIEKSMNQLLYRGGSDSLVAVVDSYEAIIPSLGFRKIEKNALNEKYAIKLTLDYHIQAITEQVMKNNKINGSAVVMDVSTGDILAMVSTPDFDQNNVGDYIGNGGDQLINKSITSYDLGSIFKTVVAAAAIENNLVDDNETFLCEGEIEVNNNKIKCSTIKSHENRPITLKEAFALSCNTTFLKVGMRIGSDKILEMAKRFGFGEKQCSELLEEKAGYIPASQEEGIGNISIGQGKIQVTPLQVTTMMATIANNGIMHQSNIIEELVRNDTGTTVKKMSSSEPQVILKASTAKKLQDMLKEVTITGTGKLANLDEFGGSSGKTSSAETGINSGEIVHGWFAGYVPSDKPKYAITVFVYNGHSGGKSAAPIFREIANKIFTEYQPVK